MLYSSGLASYQNMLLNSEPTLPTSSSESETLDLAITKQRYLACEGRGIVSYENINVDQINQLCNEGFEKVITNSEHLVSLWLHNELVINYQLLIYHLLLCTFNVIWWLGCCDTSSSHFSEQHPPSEGYSKGILGK